MRTHSTFYRALAASAAIMLFAGCGPRADSQETCSGKCDGPGGKQYVVDTSKTGPYGDTGKYFWGVEMSATELAELAGVGAALQPLNVVTTQLLQGSLPGLRACDAQNQNCGATFAIIWDQLHNVTPGWPTLIFDSAENANSAVTVMQQQFGVSYQVVAIVDGEYVAAPGQMNIVPMKKNTAPQNQDWIRGTMQDGDVITYIHPEYTGMSNLMERRASHVAMHYEWQTRGNRQLVHHIDNPDGYGPQYNHDPSRHMPFHAYRLKHTEAAQYGKAARSWAMITNDLSPFAGFFDLRLQSAADLDKFANPALNGNEIPVLYCSGLAYANLNLAVNRPLTQAGLSAAQYQTFTNPTKTWLFSDADEDYGSSQLTSDISADLPRWSAEDKLVFSPYAATDILNNWVDNTFRGIPESLAQLPFLAPALPALTAQTANTEAAPLYAPGAPFRTALVTMVVQNPAFQEQVVNGFYELEWGETGSGRPEPAMPPNALTNAALWAGAYVATLSGVSAADFRRAPCAFIKGAETCNADAVIATADGTVSLEAAVSLATKDPVATLAIQNATTPNELVTALANAKGGVANRFVPPRIWLDNAERKSGNMQYMATVINCELLSAADGSGHDACDGSGGPIESYKEGGADSHTYSHFALRAGQQITHRRVDATRGPERFGEGTKVTVRLTANRPQDVIFAVHVPAHWLDSDNDPAVQQSMNLAVWPYGDFCTARQQGETMSTCVPKRGILLRPDTNWNSTPDANEPDSAISPVLNMQLSFDLLKDGNCTIVDDDWLECDLVEQTVANGRTQVAYSRGRVSRSLRVGPKNYFVATAIHTGQAQGPSELDLRSQQNDPSCTSAARRDCIGASSEPNSVHFDVWHIEIWNGTSSSSGDDYYNGEGEEWDDSWVCVVDVDNDYCNSREEQDCLLNVRKNPCRDNSNPECTSIDTVPENTLIDIIDTFTDGRQVIWYKTTLNGQSGWLSSKHCYTVG